ncbi:MAG: DUF1566 domain-containing protein [Polaromonas sp.]
MRFLSARLLGLSFFLMSGALLPLSAANAQERYTASADGQEISDSKTGLTWRRCVEGMSWKKNTCSGKASFVNHADAAALAKAAGGEWRLPVLKELSGIVAVREAEEGKAAIDPRAFPGTPPARFWTGSSVGTGYFMFVAFTEGSAGEGARNAPGAVRLVRGK